MLGLLGPPTPIRYLGSVSAVLIIKSMNLEAKKNGKIALLLEV